MDRPELQPEVDPLKCQKCGGDMKVVGFIDSEATAYLDGAASVVTGFAKDQHPPPVLSNAVECTAHNSRRLQSCQISERQPLLRNCA